MIVKSLVRKIKIQRLKGRGVRSGVGCIRAYDGFSVVLQPSVRKKTLFMVGDSGRIVGQVLENKKPVARRVFCYHRRTGELVATTTSGDDGFYQFDNLVKGMTYYLVSIDEENDGTHYNLTGQDLVIAQ